MVLRQSEAKRDFRDLLLMRYSMPIPGLPGTCPRGKSYSLDHSQDCKLRGFIQMRHNDPEEMFANYCREAFNDVEV